MHIENLKHCFSRALKEIFCNSYLHVEIANKFYFIFVFFIVKETSLVG